MTRCRTEGCQEVVEYEPKPVNGVVGAKLVYERPQGRIKIYLTCDVGHTHPYVIHPKLSR